MMAVDVLPQRGPKNVPLTLPPRVLKSRIIHLAPPTVSPRRKLFYDLSGNQFNGQFKYGCEWRDGRIGLAVYFDGVDDRMIIPHDNLMNSNSQSFEMWFKPESLPTGSEPIKGVVYKMPDTGYRREFNMIMKNVRNIQVTYGDPTNNRLTNLIAQVLYNKKWTHVVGVKERMADGYDDVYMYVDAVLEASNTDGTYTYNQNSNNIAFADFEGNLSSRRGNFYMDEFNLYNRALTAAEIKLLYELGRLTRQPKVV